MTGYRLTAAGVDVVKARLDLVETEIRNVRQRLNAETTVEQAYHLERTLGTLTRTLYVMRGLRSIPGDRPPSASKPEPKGSQ